jgi:hypothetical protein
MLSIIGHQLVDEFFVANEEYSEHVILSGIEVLNEF